MRKGSCALLLAVLSLVLCGLDRHAGAIEADSNVTVTNIPVANSAENKTAPRLVNVGEEKKSDDQDKGTQEETKKYHEPDTKGSFNEKKDKPIEEPKAKHYDGKQSFDGRSDPKTLPLEDSPVEGCDPSSRCIDEKNKFIACLRVPGKDSLDLSLLLQNRGTRALDVKIVAPDFVNLEKTLVKLQAKQNEEVKIFVSDNANDTTITLTAEDGNCSLNLRYMIPTYARRSETSRLARYLSLPIHTFSISMIFTALVSAGAAWLCIRFWRIYRKTVSRYQKVDMGLPVSTGGNKETGEMDGWDNSWGDGWDEEAARNTPPKPVSTPSSKGLASRRLNKDGWND